METIVIPIFGSRISPRLDLTQKLQLFRIKGNRVIERETINIVFSNRLERINNLLGLNADTIICDGISDLCKEELEKHNVKVVAWVQGEVEEVIKNYLSSKTRSNSKINSRKTK